LGVKVLSLFSGVGGFDMGLEAAGYETIFQCEWDVHCTRVLNKHWPNVPKWGDVSTLTGAHVLDKAGPPDVVAWGSPCQDLSVAGKRAGLAGAKSGLFHDGIRIIKEIRELTNNVYPRFSIWENVPGALSSNGGADFGVVLDEMAQAGALELEWAVLDAQYFGVAQRRRRIFLVAVFDPADASRSRGKVLPVAEGMPRNSKARGKKGQGAAPATAASAQSSGGESGAVAFQPGTMIRAVGGHWDEQAPTLRAESKSGDNSPHVAQPFVKSRHAKDSEDYETWVDGTVSPTLNTFENHTDTRATVAIVSQDTVKDVSNTITANIYHHGTVVNQDVNDGHMVIVSQDPVNEVAATITATYSKLVANSIAEEGNLLPVTVIDRAAFNQGPNAKFDTVIREDTAVPALVARGPHAVGQQVDDIVFENSYRDGVRIAEHDVSQTLSAKMGTGGNNTPMVVQNGQAVIGFEPGAVSRLASDHHWEEISPTLRAEMGDNQAAVAIPIDTRNALRDPEKYDEQNRQGMGIGADGDPMATLTSAHVNAVAQSVGEGRPREEQNSIVFDDDRRVGPRLFVDKVNTLQAFMGTGGNNTPMVAQNPIAFATNQRSEVRDLGDKSAALSAEWGTNQQTYLAIPIQDGREIEKNQNGLGVGGEDDPSYTLDQTGSQSIAYSIREDATVGNFSATPIDVANAVTALQPSAQSHHAQTFVTQPTEDAMYSFDTQFGSNAAVFEDQSPTLKATQAPASVAYQYDGYNQNLEEGDGVYRSLRVGRDPSDFVMQSTSMVIRRLTPLECERLMGWPDDHTKYDADEKVIPDTQRYKMCGNGVASPVARWVGQKLRDFYLGQQP